MVGRRLCALEKGENDCKHLPVVLQVGEDVVHDAGNQRNGLLLLVAAVDHVQERCQDLSSEMKSQIEKEKKKKKI